MIRDKLALAQVLAMTAGMSASSGLSSVLPAPYIPTNGAVERRMRGPLTQADHDALAKAEAKRERKAEIRRRLVA